MRALELFDLSGQTALVTGGGRGIGRHLAIGLAEAGAHVYVVSRKLDACEEVAAAIEAEGGQATALAADISKPEDIDALVARILEQSSRIDVLINNAAMAWSAPILDYPLSGWDRVFDLNVRGVFYLSQQVARRMRDTGGGSIIHVSSISAFRTSGDETEPVVAYNASKGAVVSLTIDMAVKLAPYGIRVNGIAPGPFLTAMMDHIRHDAAKLEAFNRQVPLQRSGGEDDIKGAAVFLASRAGAFVTGHTLVVDGGMLCSSPAR
jgi:NAD(P)-dependent dehydrogenase (short-subunit alcohol dehydrogenase family)